MGELQAQPLRKKSMSGCCLLHTHMRLLHASHCLLLALLDVAHAQNRLV